MNEMNDTQITPSRFHPSDNDDRQKLQGIITPLITPLQDRDTLDHAGLERLIEHVLNGGVHGVFALGTTGEAAALSAAVHRELIRRLMVSVAGRVPVLVGVSHNSIVESLRLSQEAADMGATAIVLTTPSYLPLDQVELVRYIRLFDRESCLPILLYNIPRLTSHWFDIATIREAMQLENVIGLKDSSGDMIYFGKILDLLVDRPDWSLFTGPETLLADAVMLGAHGCVGGSSNLWRQLLVDLYHAALQNDQSRIAMLQQVLQELAEIYQFGAYATGVIRGLKCSLEILGICSGRMADPFNPCDASQRNVIEQRLRKLGLIASKERRTSPRPTRSAISESTFGIE
jgi:4-hydroxy-tetrahydrodipicolinate synthase